MRSSACLALLAALLVLQCARDGRSQFGACDYNTLCLEKYNAIELAVRQLNNSVRCPILQDAWQCLESSTCSDFGIQVFKGHLVDLMGEFECWPTASPVPTPSISSAMQSTPTPVPCPAHPHTLPCDSPLGECCPHLPPRFPDNCEVIQYLGTPDLYIPPPPSDCSVPVDDRLTMQHCSMFTYSHLRPFGAYELGVQLCSLAGSWYLVKHPGFSVEVSTDGDSVRSPYTMLSKVNVTFFNHSCSLGKSYVAERSAALSHSFSDGQASTPTLQLWVDGDGRSVSILATWLNTSIVIRSYAQYLSVAVQVPGKFIFESEGLCNGGCPAHGLLNARNSVDSMTADCPDDNQRAGFHCYAAGVLNADQTTFYGESCMFDALKSGSIQVLSVVNASVRDALLLPNVGPVPSPEPPTTITDPPTTSSQPPSTADTDPPTDPPIVGTEDPTDRTDLPFTNPSSQSPMHPYTHLFSVLFSLVAVLLLR